MSDCFGKSAFAYSCRVLQLFATYYIAVGVNCDTTMATAAASPAGDPGSSLGGQYEKLLATVGNLQGDLQRTVGVCQVRVARVEHIERDRESWAGDIVDHVVVSTSSKK